MLAVFVVKAFLYTSTANTGLALMCNILNWCKNLSNFSTRNKEKNLGLIFLCSSTNTFDVNIHSACNIYIWYRQTGGLRQHGVAYVFNWDNIYEEENSSIMDPTAHSAV